ncbi:thioether cross-link-forming SCIFF peptide maturase [Aceticella autotrophica]|uniref:Thioether cross-link-forming SCIFF peptide maturase n=1 Tax=Aceticella autotrophica TaxID=2755338 RepID=A0A975GA16_9THEO|nr:thioether cross-link-forming SCIFF peptide maturase [Aceticella autotrophica]QSZ26727.1 thioether cross-link-forming SCIFF peptide maturase [Aceticella autotrophica]
MGNSIHKFKQLGMNILLDPVSGAIHIVDDLTYDILDYYGKNSKDDIINIFQNKYPKDDIIDILDEIDELKAKGLLFSEDIYKNMAINRTDSVIKAMCLNIAHDCNLRCKYCFASTGDFNGGRKLMTFETGKKAIDFLIKSSGNRKNVEVDFFGGEPLMNYDVIKKLVDYGRKQAEHNGKTIKYTITTNAVLLDDEKIRYFNENFTNVVLSLDGRKEINDQMRIKIDKSGSYDIIVPKIKKFADSRGNKEYYVRGTFTAKNLDFTNDVLHIADLSIREVSVEPVVEKENTDYALREEHLDKILKEYDKLAEEYVKRIDEGNPFSFYHFKINLDNGPCIRKRLQGCGAGFEYVAVTPNEEIYPCHQFVGNEEYKLGTLDQGIVNDGIRQLFMGSDIYKREECTDCWVRFFCSGGCFANNYNMNGDINKPYKLSCEMQKKRFECAIAVKAYQMMREGGKIDKKVQMSNP